MSMVVFIIRERNYKKKDDYKFWLENASIIYWINSTSFKMEGPTNMYKCSGSVGFIGGMQPLITPTAPLIAASTKSDVTL